MCDKETDFKEGSCDVILDTAKTSYTEEADRFKQAEAKTNISIAFAGVLLGIYVTYLGSFEPITKAISYLIYSYSLKLVILLFFSISIIYLLHSIKTEEYQKVSLNNIVKEERGRDDTSLVKINTAFTYKEAIDKNKVLIEKKMKVYNKGLNLAKYGFILFIIHFIIEEVINYVQ